MRIKKGDKVIVKKGKDAGKTGEIMKVFPLEDKLIVKGINIKTMHKKPMGPTEPGGIIEVEGPIHVSNVMYYCKNDKQGVRVGYKFLEDGKKVRVCKKCGEVLDK